MASNEHYPVLRPCLAALSVALCLVGVAGVLLILQSIEEMHALGEMNASGSEYLPYYLFFPAEAAAALALLFGIMGCLTAFGRLCLIPSCVLGGVWSVVAVAVAGRLFFSFLTSPDMWTASYLPYALVMLVLFAIPLLWTAMTIVYVRRVRKERREGSQPAGQEQP